MKNLNDITLQSGSHKNSDDGMCAMEAVAWLADEPHSDRPICTSEALAAYVISLNDAMPDDFRQRLKEFVPRLIGTRNEALELKRAQYLAWSAITVIVPVALDSVGLTYYAETLRHLLPHDWSAAYAATDAAADAARSANTATSADAAYFVSFAARAATLAATYAHGGTEAIYDAACATRAADYAAAAAYHTARSVTNPNDVWELALSALSSAIELT